MPVGIMCFKGLGLHYEDIIKLLESSPQTNVIIDHFGFFVQGKMRSIFTYTHIYIYRSVYRSSCGYICIYAYIYVCIQISVYMYSYTYSFRYVHRFD
jgi:hypothetical protein